MMHQKKRFVKIAAKKLAVRRQKLNKRNIHKCLHYWEDLFFVSIFPDKKPFISKRDGKEIVTLIKDYLHCGRAD